MPTVGKLSQSGDLKLSGDINSRLPLVTDGLVHHMPMDTPAGTFDIIGGVQSIQNSSENVNLIEAMHYNWRDPNSWVSHNSNWYYDEAEDAMRITGYFNSWLKTPIIIDPTKTYEISVEIKETVQSSIGLYLGGYSTDANGTRATNNYDYTLASNDQPSTGVWKTYRLTRTGTATAGSSTSTSFSTVKGWTGDAGLLIKHYYFGGLFNYNSGGQLYLRNPSIRVIDGDTSNTTITDDYVAIEEATTNMVPENVAIFQDFNGWVCYDSPGPVTRELLYNYSPSGRNAVKIEKGDTASGGYFQIQLSATPIVAAGQTYTAQIKYKREDSSTNFGIGDWGGPDGNNPGWTTILDIDIGNGWRQRVAQRTYTNGGSLGTFGVNSTSSGKWLIFCDFKLENKLFYTEFNVGGKLKPALSYNLGITSSGTVHFSFVKKWYDTYANGNGAYFMIGDGTNLYTFTGNTNVMNIWAADTSSNETTRISYTGINIGEKNIMTVTWNLRLLKLYMNGNFVGEFTNFGYEEIVNKNIYFGSEASGSRIANVTIKDMSVYNRALTSDEIKKLAKGTHSITNSGLISNSPINSKPFIPSDAYYFDLGANGKDEYKLITPTEDTANYSSGDAYVGGNSLEYNLNSSIGLNWGGNWSICYMKKPIGTSNGSTNLTGYNIESLGCNSNSVGGGYIWWGKTSGSNLIYGATNSTFTPSDYFNNWEYVTMVKTGTSIVITSYLKDRVVRSRTIVVTASANYYVTQYGYDLKLGGWDNNGGCYTHFRNLIVLKRAMTTDELNNYRLNKMKATKDGIYVQNGISSQETL